MSRIKCQKCDLINFASDRSCRRCGAEMNAGKSSSGLPTFYFSGIVKKLMLLGAGVLCYYGYQTFDEKTSNLSQQIQQNNQKPVQVPNQLKGYENSIKNEIKKIPTPTPVNNVK